MHRKLIGLLFLAIFQISNAREIPYEEACRIAASFWYNDVPTRSTANEIQLLWDGNGLLTKSTPSHTPFYVFGRTGQKGFVVIAGDDRLRRVLAWSDENEFDPQNIPANSLWWYEGIGDFVASNTKSSSTKSSNYTKRDSVIIKHTTAKWNQGYPYNLECPENKVTGCVNTAIAIIMKWHQWPDCGVGTTGAYTSPYGVFVPSRVLGEPYNWEDMPMTTEEFVTDKQRSEIARLMADIGAASQAEYGGPDGTGTYSHKALYACQGYFKYHSQAELIYRSTYGDENWFELVRKELKKGPIYYVGEDPSWVSHAFVVDGITKNNYLHVNWGWGGSLDGYYAIDSMQGFNESQYMSKHFVPTWNNGYDSSIIMVDIGAGYNGIQILESDNETMAPKRLSLGTIYYLGTGSDKHSIRLCVIDRYGNEVQEVWRDTFSGPIIHFDDISIDIKKIDFGYRLIAQYYDTKNSSWEKIMSTNKAIDVILLADEYSIEETTTFSFLRNYNKIEISVKEGVTASCYTSDNEIPLEKEENRYILKDIKEISGTILFRLTKGKEEVEFKVILGE